MESVEAGRRRSGRQHWILGALTLTTFLVPLHFGMELNFWERVLDFLHLPAFAAIALYFFRFLPLASADRRILWSFAICTAVAGLIEILQAGTGRQASWDDFVHGMMGAFVGLLGRMMWPRRSWFRPVYVLYAAFLSAYIALPAWREWKCIARRDQLFPVISDFESIEDFRRWTEQRQGDVVWGVKVERSTVNVSQGQYSLRINLLAHPLGAVRVFLADQDWRPYHALAFDIFNPGQPWELSIRIDDHNPPAVHDRFYRSYQLAHGWNHERIPLSEIHYKGQPLDLSAMRRIVFFLFEPKAEENVFYLDWMRLE